MNKVSQITKQLTFIHKELRRTKQFFKASSINFSSFHSHMKSALDDLNHCDIFNDIQFTNYNNAIIVDTFIKKISSEANAHMAIHDVLKEEGENIKTMLKELSKKKKDDDIDMTLVNSATSLILQVRQKIKSTFDSYISSLCSFAETRAKLESLMIKCDESYRCDQPNLSKKLSCAFGIENKAPMMNLTNNFSKGENEDSVDKVNHFFSTQKKPKRKSFRNRSVDYDSNRFYIDNPQRMTNASVISEEKNIFKRVDTNVLNSVIDNDMKKEDVDSPFGKEKFSVHDVKENSEEEEYN